MLRLTTISVLLAGLVACGMSEDEYTDGVAAAACDVTWECSDDATKEALGWESVDDCLNAGEDTEEGEEVECDFDADVAATCLTEWEALTCDDYPAGLPTCNPFTC